MRLQSIVLIFFFVRKKLPKLVLCAGDSSSDTSTFEQRSQSFRSSLSQPTKSQSLPGARKLKYYWAVNRLSREKCSKVVAKKGYLVVDCQLSFERNAILYLNQIFAYTRCITPKCVMSQGGLLRQLAT